MRLVGKHGTKRWAIISQELNKEVPGFRSGKQCRTRWLNHLDPGKRQENWTTIEGIAQRLNQFPEIACEVRGETTEAQLCAALAPLVAAAGRVAATPQAGRSSPCIAVATRSRKVRKSLPAIIRWRHGR